MPEGAPGDNRAFVLCSGSKEAFARVSTHPPPQSSSPILSEGPRSSYIVSMMADRRVLPLIVVAAACAASVLQAQQPCNRLLKHGASTVSITLATEIETGTFTPGDSTTALTNLPGFCRVTATLKPTTDSDIHAESGSLRLHGTASFSPSAAAAGEGP